MRSEVELVQEVVVVAVEGANTNTVTKRQSDFTPLGAVGAHAASA